MEQVATSSGNGAWNVATAGASGAWNKLQFQIGMVHGKSLVATASGKAYGRR
jgi:hypothetical protein